MAITQVRARLGTEWVGLTYNPATGRYEGTVTPTGTSFHQPGGYFPLTAEASNDSGRTESISGDALKSLRLVVRETVSPVLTLVSPEPGYLTVNNPTLVFEVVDESGGSGVDPATAKTTLDGADVPCTVEESRGGYRITLTSDGLSDGPHTVTAAVSDYDGNLATVSGAYFVDTVPPSVEIDGVAVHVVDVDRVTFRVNASDGGSGVGRISVDPQAEAAGDTYTAPLNVGENNIVVTVSDRAGNISTDTLYMIRLVTDRTAVDVEKVLDLYRRGAENWTAEELEWFNTATVRGGYNDTDLNRVGAAVRYLAGELSKRGYSPSAVPKTGWTAQDAPTESSMKTYLNGVRAVITAQPLVYLMRQPLPSSIRKLDTTGANQIEKALTQVEEPFSRYRSWSCGEISCGES